MCHHNRESFGCPPSLCGHTLYFTDFLSPFLCSLCDDGLYFRFSKASSTDVATLCSKFMRSSTDIVERHAHIAFALVVCTNESVKVYLSRNFLWAEHNLQLRKIYMKSKWVNICLLVSYLAFTLHTISDKYLTNINTLKEYLNSLYFSNFF